MCARLTHIYITSVSTQCYAMGVRLTRNDATGMRLTHNYAAGVRLTCTLSAWAHIYHCEAHSRLRYR